MENLICWKCARGTDPNLVPSKVGDVIYISGEENVYLHTENEKGEKVFVPLKKVSYN